MPTFLACTCSSPVRKLCVKKNPPIQKLAGGPPSIHPRRNSILFVKSEIQPPSGFSDGYDTFAHEPSSWLLYTLLNNSSSSEVITISPSIAFISSSSDSCTVRTSLLNLAIS